jgi:hypothetical protein
MSTPTHDEISLEAQKLWQNRGCPDGCDNEIWLEAERKLMEAPAANTFVARTSAEAASEREVEKLPSPIEQEQMSTQEALQKENARAPQTPRHTGPKPKTAETGKPLWNRPHSS